MFLTNLQVLVQFSCSLIIAFITTRFFYTSKTNTKQIHRFDSLDGLRGLLAFFVFQHHAFIWYFLIHNKRWAAPKDLFVKNLGEVSVVFFFLITGFLFINKIRTTSSTLDWRKIFLYRFRRLIPLYFFAIFVLCLFILANSQGVLRQPISTLLQQLGHWFSFNLFLKQDHLDINGFYNTHLILGGVTWTLKYEWLFYLSLPLIALIMGKKPNWIWLIIGVVAFYFLIMHSLSQRRLYLVFAFFLGGLASKLIDYSTLRAISRTKFASIFLVVGFLMTFFVLPKAFSFIGVNIIGILFILVVTGCDMFGALEHPILKKMGEISYSIYLLHGLVLFSCFYMVIGMDFVRNLGAYEYILLISFLTVLIFSLSVITFRYIELRFMNTN